MTARIIHVITIHVYNKIIIYIDTGYYMNCTSHIISLFQDKFSPFLHFILPWCMVVYTNTHTTLLQCHNESILEQLLYRLVDNTCG